MTARCSEETRSGPGRGDALAGPPSDFGRFEWELSTRAEATRDVLNLVDTSVLVDRLRSAGIDPERASARGKGESKE
jgi:hypothetical protein